MYGNKRSYENCANAKFRNNPHRSSKDKKCLIMALNQTADFTKFEEIAKIYKKWHESVNEFS